MGPFPLCRQNWQGKKIYTEAAVAACGPGPEQNITTLQGQTSVAVRLAPGTWHIEVQAFLAGSIYAEAEETLSISGGSTAKTITLHDMRQWIVTTIVGDGTSNFVDGPESIARFDFPTGITCDSAGNLFITDTENNSIRKLHAFTHKISLPVGAKPAVWRLPAWTITGGIS